MLNVKALLTKLMDSVKADYVVEQGTSGNWSYTKWNSGKLECWYEGNPGSYTVGTARGSLYSGGTITYNYPIAFVDDYPSVTASAMLGTTAYVIWAQSSGLSLNSVDVRIVASASMAANTNFSIHIHAVGKWK